MADAATSWTDERVELLSKLWGEGLSASQIAALLGGGVTRNAVIGKVHRLGLSGRVKAGQPAAPRPAKPREPSAPGSAAGAGPGTARPRVAVPVLEARASTTFLSAASPAAVSQEVEIPVSQRVSILELRETMCRWPLGDPQSAEFGFCGSRTATGLPYCVVHCRVAYQPASERKRLRA